MDNLIGKRLDGLYEVQELIGSGGMANVYKAVMRGQNGPVPAGTVVAVKVLRQEYSFFKRSGSARRSLSKRFFTICRRILLPEFPGRVRRLFYGCSAGQTLPGLCRPPNFLPILDRHSLPLYR